VLLFYFLFVSCFITLKNGFIVLFGQEAFAVVREASKRVLGLRPFDVQLIGTTLKFVHLLPALVFAPPVIVTPFLSF